MTSALQVGANAQQRLTQTGPSLPWERVLWLAGAAPHFLGSPLALLFSVSGPCSTFSCFRAQFSGLFYHSHSLGSIILSHGYNQHFHADAPIGLSHPDLSPQLPTLTSTYRAPIFTRMLHRPLKLTTSQTGYIQSISGQTLPPQTCLPPFFPS